MWQVGRQEQIKHTDSVGCLVINTINCYRNTKQYQKCHYTVEIYQLMKNKL